MKLLHFNKIATLASLLALSNISCAADPVKPATTAPATTYPSTESTTHNTAPPNGKHPGHTFIYIFHGQNGLLIPIDKYGKPFEECGQDGNNKAAHCTITEQM